MTRKMAIVLFVALFAGRLEAQLKITTICEERYKNNDLALVIPEQQEIFVRSGADGPWGFAFAGFETTVTSPLELEVSGSGGYQAQDIFSIAALSVDFGSDKGWIERSIFGLGLIQGSREPHPPGWGVGVGAKPVMRGELIAANPQAAKVTLDLKKYAPPGWNGRVWIGLLMHNVGASKSLSVRIGSAKPAELSDDARLKLLRQHEEKFLRDAVEQLEKRPAVEVPDEVVKPMRPYAKHQLAEGGPAPIVAAMRATLSKFDKSPPEPATFVTHAEAFFAFQNQKAEHRDVTTGLNAFYKAWEEAGKFGEPINCVIRAATNLDKVGLTDTTTGRMLGKNPDPIHISAARHEYEAFQIVLTPLLGMKNLNIITASALKSDRGEIPSRNISIDPVGYVRIYPGQPQERIVPDPLLPTLPPLSAGENQPFWISVHVPPDAAPGEYRGSVSIRSDTDEISIPVILRVRDFAIPKKISLRSSFWMFRDQLNRFYGVKEIELDDYLKWIDFALAHRINPIDTYEGACGNLYDICQGDVAGIGTAPAGEPKIHPDFTKLDKYIDRMVAGGANTIHLGPSHHFGGFFSDKENPIASPGQIARVEKATKILQQHFREKNVYDMHYLQLRDETSEPDSLNVYRGLHKDIPDAKLLLTAMSPEARSLLNIPCPLSPSFDAAWRDEVKGKGGEYWWYVCLSPRDPYANLFIFQTGRSTAPFWQTWSHGVDGLLYWGLNYWTDYNAAHSDKMKGPTERASLPQTFTIGAIPQYPGDGFSIYPGPTISEPLSSIRLECIRDGEEDYEYFVMLDALVKKAGNSAKVDEARKVLDDARKLVEDMTKYEKTGQPYLDIRDRVADAIEKLSKP